MPRAFTQNYYHMVFSTKGRRPLITPDLEPRLHAFLGGIVKDLRCTSIAINGMDDHVHLLLRYPTDLSHSDLLRNVKGRSSKWVNESFESASSAFAWQNGYGGFTVSKSLVDKVARYIDDQKIKLRRKDFKTEFLELLRKHDVEFDEREVFD